MSFVITNFSELIHSLQTIIKVIDYLIKSRIISINMS